MKYAVRPVIYHHISAANGAVKVKSPPVVSGYIVQINQTRFRLTGCVLFHTVGNPSCRYRLFTSCKSGKGSLSSGSGVLATFLPLTYGSASYIQSPGALIGLPHGSGRSSRRLYRIGFRRFDRVLSVHDFYTSHRRGLYRSSPGPRSSSALPPPAFGISLGSSAVPFRPPASHLIHDRSVAR